jgi:hypothetical protein
LIRAVKAALLSLSAAAVLVSLPRYAYASPGPVHRPEPSKLWLVKQNDLASIGEQYQPLFRWDLCGVATQTGPNGPAPNGECQTGQVPTYASYVALQQAIADGQVVKGDVILFDQEPWKYTPASEQAKPAHYATLVGQLCEADGIVLVFTAAEHNMYTALNVDKAAAPYAYAVSVQTQRNDGNPARFLSFARRAATALRAVNRKVQLMIGLATDAGGTPVSAADMLRDYRETYALADGFWLNSNAWPPPIGKGCAPEGCPKVADQFLADVASLTKPDVP